MAAIDLVVCSHRGPFIYERTRGDLTVRRGGGGLIGAVEPVLEKLGGTWIAAALGDDDRYVAREYPRGRDEAGFRLRLLDLPRDIHGLHYDVVSNEHLWFLFHYLFDVPNEPAFGRPFRDAWNAYRRVNELYAEAAIDAGRADALIVHDYHLMLVGSLVRGRSRARRPILYFHHTPWCDPEYFSLLPDDVGTEILHAMLAYDVIGFHARRWANAFLACCERFLGAKVSDDVVTSGKRTSRVVIAPVPLDVDRLDGELDDPTTEEWAARHDEARDGRTLLLRVDRIDLSKNPLRGFLAFEQLLDRRPALARDVLFLALLYPSRLNVESYRRYFTECLGVVRRVNERYESRRGEEGPIDLHFADDYNRSLGAMCVYDVLLVNPVFDGLNLVAKEGGYGNRRAGALILSRNAGVFEEIGGAAIAINPFDITETAAAIERAIEMSHPRRERRARELRKLVTRTTPTDWIGAQLAAAGISI